MARITLSSHWKFQRLARALGSKVLARGILETLWEPCWVAGDAYVGTADDIEALCEWKGETGALVKALLMEDAKGAGFIEPYEGRVRTGEVHYQVHDFLHHCPEYARQRRERHLSIEGVRNCAVCGDEIFRTNTKSMYCSPRCKQTAFRHRRIDERYGALRNAIVTPTVTNDEPADAALVTVRDRDETVCYDPNSVTVTNGDFDSPKSEQTHQRDRVCYDCDDVQYSTVLRDSSTPDLVGVGTAERKTARAATVTPTVTNPVTESPAEPPPDPDPDPPGLEFVAQSATKTQPIRKRSRRRLAARKTRAPYVEPKSSAPVVLTFPVVGEGGPWWYLREDQIATWQSLYPNLSVLEESRKALAWISADSMRRKSAGGMRKCLVGWFNRSLDHLRGRGPAPQLAANAAPVPTLSVWDTCPHTPVCETQWRCAQRIALEEAKGTRYQLPRKDGRPA